MIKQERNCLSCDKPLELKTELDMEGKQFCDRDCQKRYLSKRWGNISSSKWTECKQGHNHQSKREADRCDSLHLLAGTGAITGLEQQPKFILQPAFKLAGKTIRAITYTADFQYWDVDNQRVVVEDVKGFARQVYKLKKKLLLFMMRNEKDWEFTET